MPRSERTDGERGMIRPLLIPVPVPETVEKFTSLQPTYEDTVAPETEDWDHEDSAS